jgi:hypothetical protein
LARSRSTIEEKEVSMSTLVRRRAGWLAAGLAGLLLLAACTAVTPEATETSQLGEGQVTTEATGPPTAVPEETGSQDTPKPSATPKEEYRIVTLLSPDAIRAIDNPQFYDVSAADLEYEPDELVLGVELNGEARAYPMVVLSRVEIVNDTIGDQPIAVTY